MQVIHGVSQVPAEARGAVLAIGNFDGVHRGHQALIREVVEVAARTRKRAGVMMFEPHPREHFAPTEPHFRLTSLDEKLAILARFGLDLAVVLPFDAHLAHMLPLDFIERVLVSGLGVSHVVVGYDFFFGKARAGTPETLKGAGRELDFGVSVIAPVAESGEVYSSSAVRLKLARGDVRAAARDLGHWWRVTGTVVGGAKRGTGLGFPTANVPLRAGTALGHGIYAVRVEVDGARHEAAAYLGTRPTFDDGKPVLEVFLFDFDGDLYGRDIAVAFIDFIRADRRFADIEALKAQMAADCAKAREILAAAGDTPE